MLVTDKGARIYRSTPALWNSGRRPGRGSTSLLVFPSFSFGKPGWKVNDAQKASERKKSSVRMPGGRWRRDNKTFIHGTWTRVSLRSFELSLSGLRGTSSSLKGREIGYRLYRIKPRHYYIVRSSVVPL